MHPCNEAHGRAGVGSPTVGDVDGGGVHPGSEAHGTAGVRSEVAPELHPTQVATARTSGP